ncbi:MAG TPA: glycosyltransferase family 39 protein [Methylomirabilota bacterium]|nr:glycosyltransferase family 39 protein [Methylomirabilota bacterium]
MSPRARGALLVLGVTALLVLPPLGQRVLAPSDEARFVLYARDVLEHHAPFDVHVRAKLFREKPPLYAWLIALASLPVGRVTEATAQLPIALAALAAAGVTFLIGGRLFGPRVGMIAGLALAVTYGFFIHSQYLLPDMLVVAFACVAVYALLVWQQAEPPVRGAAIGFYVATAFAVYAKGPVGLLPFLVGGVWLWAERGPAGLRRLWSAPGAVAFALVTLTWVGPFLMLGGGSFAEVVVWEDWIRWYVGRPRLVNLLEDTAVMCLPWTPLLPLILGAALRRRDVPVVRLLLAWFLVSFLVILPIANQRTRYLLPMTPPLALLVAWWATFESAAFPRLRRALATLALLAGAAAGVLIAWPGMLGALEPPYLAAMAWTTALPLLLAVVLLTLALAGGLYAAHARLLVTGAVVATAVALVVGVQLHNRAFNAEWDFPGLAAAVERQAQGGEVGIFGGRWFALDYYLGRPVYSAQTLEEFTEYVRRPERPLVVTNGRTWAGVRRTLGDELTVLDEKPVGGQTMVLLRASRPGAAPGAR